MLNVLSPLLIFTFKISFFSMYLNKLQRSYQINKAAEIVFTCKIYFGNKKMKKTLAFHLTCVAYL